MEEFHTNSTSFLSMGQDKCWNQNMNYQKIKVKSNPNAYVEPFFLKPNQTLPKPGEFHQEINKLDDALILEIAKKVEAEPILVPTQVIIQDDLTECWGD